MSLDQDLEAYFNNLYDRLHADHVRAEVLALHKVVLAEQLAAHLGLQPVVNPQVEQIKAEHAQQPQA